MTTPETSLAAEIAAATATKCCHSVEAPMSGGERGAKNGTLAISVTHSVRFQNSQSLDFRTLTFWISISEE